MSESRLIARAVIEERCVDENRANSINGCQVSVSVEGKFSDYASCDHSCLPRPSLEQEKKEDDKSYDAKAEIIVSGTNVSIKIIGCEELLRNTIYNGNALPKKSLDVYADELAGIFESYKHDDVVKIQAMQSAAKNIRNVLRLFER